MTQISGKHVLLTGGSRGIGPVIAAALAGARLERGEDAFRAAWQAAENLSLDEACKLALEALEET